MTSLSRRELLVTTGGIVLAGSACTLPDTSEPGAGDLDLNTPEQNLRAFIRMQASLREEDVPWWYNGTIYGVIGEEKNPQALLRFEGMEMYWVSHLDDGSYELTGNTVTFFRDLDGHMIDRFDNPYTGKTNSVSPAVQGGGAGRGFNLSVNGVRPTRALDQIPDQPLKKWWSQGADFVWLNNETVYPPGMSAPRAQSQSMFVPVDAFRDKSVLRLPSLFSSTVFMPWLRWLEMDGHPGHLVWHAAGAKLASIDQLPAEYRQRVEQEYPERMSANPRA